MASVDGQRQERQAGGVGRPARGWRASRPALLASVLAQLLLTAPLPAAPARDGTGRVVSVTDGDTLVVDTATGRHRVRLLGVDAPETGQRYGPAARDALAGLVLGRTVTLRVVGADRYGRAVGVVERDGTEVNLEMVKDGWAWHDGRLARRGELRAAGAAARQAGRGLWADRSPVPPWVWRRERRAAGNGRDRPGHPR